MSEQPAVRPGQVWADNDKRSAGRQVRVVSVDDTHATVVLHAVRPGGHQQAQLGRKTRVRLDRFRPTPTGYRLVSDVDE